jgi:hypothetical protein
METVMTRLARGRELKSREFTQGKKVAQYQKLASHSSSLAVPPLVNIWLTAIQFPECKQKQGLSPCFPADAAMPAQVQP